MLCLFQNESKAITKTITLFRKDFMQNRNTNMIKLKQKNYLIPEILNRKKGKIQAFLFYFDSFDTSDAGEEFC